MVRPTPQELARLPNEGKILHEQFAVTYFNIFFVKTIFRILQNSFQMMNANNKNWNGWARNYIGWWYMPVNFSATMDGGQKLMNNASNTFTAILIIWLVFIFAIKIFVNSAPALSKSGQTWQNLRQNFRTSINSERNVRYGTEFGNWFWGKLGRNAV